MAMSPYLASIRTKIGNDLLMVRAAAVMIFDDQGRLCLVQNAHSGEWQSVGGAVDPDETPAEAAIRETAEEIGVAVELLRVIGVYGGPEFRYTYTNGHQCAFVSIAFEARIMAGAAIADGEELRAVGWFHEHEIEGLYMSPHNRRMALDAFRRSQVTSF